ncbi:MAG: histidine kinase dimerization/phosphoacceptor domain -containing protein [Saprospiraceae bacterium]|nr:histidine kinase dimerization/phosphoacceptor domain -containing protein [Saprospiraceae bacterium]
MAFKYQKPPLTLDIVFTFLLFFCQITLVNCQKVETWSIEKIDTEPLDSSLVWLNENYLNEDTFYHELALHTLARAHATQDNRLIGEAHDVLNNWHEYHTLFTVDSTLYHAEKTLYYFKSIGNQRKIAKTYTGLATTYLRNSYFEKSQNASFEAIKLYEKLEDEQGVAEAYKSLARNFELQDQPEQSIKFANQAIQIFEQNEDHYNHSITLWSLIKSHRHLGQFDLSIKAANKCINLVDTYIPDELAIKTRGYSFRGDTEAEMGDYDKALISHYKALEIVEGAIGVDRPASKTYRSPIGTDLYHLGRPEEALPHQLAGIEGNLGLGVKSIWTEYYEVSETYKELGNFEKALEYADKANKEKFAMLDEKVQNLESEAVVKYETGKKDQALALQEQQLSQQNKIQILTGSVAAMLALLLGILFFNYRKNKKITLALEKKNIENEVLLKEIHHRVKNNLQTISSLLSLQSESISDKNAFDAVQESKNRVASMAQIHQKLYQGENLAAVEMRDYFETIGKAIIDSFGQKAENVSLKIDMLEIELDVDTAVPIGLITNELITNSIKHAFHNDEKGQISIALTQEDNGMLKLFIADDGQATLSDSSSNKNSGFGTLLIQLLTTQLGGKLEKSSDDGTSTMIQFPSLEKSAA